MKFHLTTSVQRRWFQDVLYSFGIASVREQWKYCLVETSRDRLDNNVRHWLLIIVYDWAVSAVQACNHRAHIQAINVNRIKRDVVDLIILSTNLKKWNSKIKR
ncbi:hypothetical protein T4E_1222 [Trichinella pseudospiralis]|uniref:Uncharacterized protein n=1 Tax=Trichinella pseudospiralis TaxID=6337 RepID=A0A0V0Y507_TRIPS|nr:hypothetical protein T4E_1222 [Trichinella pseudospiralis]